MKLNKILTWILLFFAVSASADNSGLSAMRTLMDREDFRDAMRFYDKEMYSRAAVMFERTGKENEKAAPYG